MRYPAPGLALVAALTLAACTPDGNEQAPQEPTVTFDPPPAELTEDTPEPGDLIPAPVSAETDAAENFELRPDTELTVEPGEQGARRAAEYLGEILRPATGFDLPVTEGESEGDQVPVIALRLTEGSSDDETAENQPAENQPGANQPGGYELDVTPGRIELAAGDADGLFAGVQTIRQLLPAEIESTEVADRRWTVAGGTVTDHPRYAYRGAMLDVARHFFDVDVVKRHIDRLAQYKINYLHLHLTDDQGWRIEIESWPELTETGAANEVGGGEGGYYTQDEYRDIVSYAQQRGITIVPEIDMPGHTNAALVSYPELNCDGEAPEPYTGTRVGFSSLCIDSELTYEFVRDVINEVAGMTPGEYLHIGGDEADATTDAEYATFFDRVFPMIVEAGKQPIGWHEYAEVALPDSAVMQYWRIETEEEGTANAAAAGNQVLMSPASAAYLDMAYHEDDPWGNDWAGPVNVRAAYDWDPAQFLDGVSEEHILGVEAPLWTELVETESDIERMAFPRMQAIAEVGWSRSGESSWEDFASRLAQHGERMDAQGIDFHRSPEISW